MSRISVIRPGTAAFALLRCAADEDEDFARFLGGAAVPGVAV